MDDANVVLLGKTVVARRHLTTATYQMRLSATEGGASARPDLKVNVMQYAVLLQANRDPWCEQGGGGGGGWGRGMGGGGYLSVLSCPLRVPLPLFPSSPLPNRAPLPLTPPP